MFKVFKYDKDYYNVIITDSDFQEKICVYDKYLPAHLPACIIEVYSRRNLNVALNFVLFMQYMNKKHGDYWSIDRQISDYKKHVKDFEQYLPEIEKYLMLM